MSKLEDFTIVALAVICFCVHIESKATPYPTYINDIVISYTDDIWHCDRLMCEAKTIGCSISRHNDVNNSAILWTNNKCYDVNNVVTATNSYGTNLTIFREIDIDLYSYNGAENEISYGWSNSSLYLKGIIAVASWTNISDTIIQEDSTEYETASYEIIVNVGHIKGTVPPKVAQEIDNIPHQVEQTVGQIQQQVEHNVDHIQQQVEQNVNQIEQQVNKKIAELQSQLENMFN